MSESYLDRQREFAARDLRDDPSWCRCSYPEWLQCPRRLICDLRVGTEVRNMDGQTMTIKRHTENGPTHVTIKGHETLVIQACAVIEVARLLAEGTVAP